MRLAVVCRPIIARSAVMARNMPVSIIPIALGVGAGGVGEFDWYDIKQPDGRVLSTGDSNRATSRTRRIGPRASSDSQQCGVSRYRAEVQRYDLPVHPRR